VRINLRLLVCFGLISACTGKVRQAVSPAAQVQTPTQQRLRLRDQARLILERHCGQCHIGEYPTALPRALAVYNLSNEEWAAKMTETQLRQLDTRIGEGGAFFDEFDVRNKGTTPAPAATTEDQQVVREYVRAQLEEVKGQQPEAAPCL
jgi:hypothetical protein